MDAVKSWAFSFCITAVAAAVVQMLVPKGSMEKVIRITVRIFLLTAIVSPLVANADLGIMNDIRFELQTEMYTQKFRQETKQIIENEISKQVENMISESLAEMGVYPDEVKAFVISLSDNEVEIEEVTVTLRSNYKIKDSDIRYKISRIVECTIRVNYTEDNAVEG